MRRLAALTAVFLLGACGAEPETTPTAARAPQASRTNPTLQLSAGRVTLVAEGVARSALLQQLAESAGFRLEQASVDWQPIDVEIQNASLAEALDLLLEGIPYSVGYEVAPGRAEHVVARVRVGRPEAPLEPRSQTTADRGKPKPTDRIASPAPTRSTVAREVEPIDEEILTNLESPDPELRISGLSALGAEGEGLRVLAGVLEGDPDPDVRGTAAEELGYAGSFGAIEALLVGLDDPDPQVVVHVLEALETTADETLIPHLEPYLEHRDPTVREAVESAIEYLE